ncbi:hypothetical protein SLEP1_g16912 [Rubroshorea leprosula]|uniref:Retrotransposon Copia-like N-terminal domain-containing protein n=1 Tax=Rubroshorea leprosula TaxID=152421 RepID=A0AAV5J1N4_9ROSI|nr:hypothetical protein SLEP1_g16912 [Rubroshorea leprosula]
MASLSSVTSSKSSPPTSLTTDTITSTSTIISHPVFSISNIKHFVPETLTHENYLLWKELIIPVLHSKGVYGHIDGCKPCLPSTDLSYEECTSPVYDKDLVLQVLAGLDQEYSSAKRTIPQRQPFPSFLQLHFLLLIEEASINMSMLKQAFIEVAGLDLVAKGVGFLVFVVAIILVFLAIAPILWVLLLSLNSTISTILVSLVFLVSTNLCGMLLVMLVLPFPIQHVDSNWVFDTATLKPVSSSPVPTSSTPLSNPTAFSPIFSSNSTTFIPIEPFVELAPLNSTASSSLQSVVPKAKPFHQHPMITRAQDGTRKVRILPSMVSTVVSILEPKTFA